MEPILQEDHKRWTIEPIQHHDIWKFYKTHESMVWHASEVKLHKDLTDWAKLTDQERHFIKMVLAFFASSDVIVGDNLAQRFMNEVQIIEARCFYAFQMFMENVHSEVYSNMITTYIPDIEERKMLFQAITTIACVAKKANWAMKWIASEVRFAIRLIAFAIVEGVFFSGSFASIYWLNERGIMPGLSLGNNFIARDEGLHTDFACHLYKNHIVNKLTQQEFADIMTEAVNVEIEFITESLPCRLIGMNAALMIDYIKYVSNRLALQLGHDPLYPNIVECPLPFMTRIALKIKVNFFENESAEYTKDVIKSGEDSYANL